MKLNLEKFGNVRENISFKTMSTYRIGGNARYVLEPQSLDDLIKAIDYLRSEHIPFKVLGMGSNILFSDEDYQGVVVRLQHALNKMEFNENHLFVEAGVSLIKCAHLAVEKGLGDLEFASGIPGSVGGALYMNAGAYQKTMYDCVNRVLIYQDKALKWLNREEIKVDYRYSSFMDDKEILICGAELNLHPCDIQNSKAIIQDRLKRRLDSQPLDLPSCGSIFRNPYPNLSWQLIESVGLRGHIIGDAQISLKHANFIVNLGQAKAQDVVDLIHLIETEVYKKHGIQLKREVEFFNFL